MCCDKGEFEYLKAVPNEFINWGNSAKVRIEGIGKVKLTVRDDLGDLVEIHLENIHYVPDFNLNLISIGVLDSKGVKMHVQGGKFVVDTGEVRIESRAMAQKVRTSKQIAVREMVKENMATGWNTDEKDQCESCLRGKLTKRPFERSASKASTRLELIHADLIGPMESSRQGAKYTRWTTTVDTPLCMD